MSSSDAQSPEIRGVRSAPRLVGLAVRLIWEADWKTVLATAVLQILGGSGIAALFLIGRSALARILEAPSVSEGLRDAAPLLVFLLFLFALQSFVTASHSGVHRLLAERTIRYFFDRVLQVSGAVDLEAFEDPSFYDRLRRAQEHGSQTSLQVSLHLPILTGSLLISAGIGVALAAIQPLLLPLVLIGALPLWVATSKNTEEMYSFSFGHTPGDRVRQHLSGLLTLKEFAPEVRAFSISEFLRNRWNQMYEERLKDVAEMVWRFLRRSVVASLTSTAVIAISIAGLLYLLATGRMDDAGAVAALIAIQQLGSQLQNMARSAGMLYESALYLEDFLGFTRMTSALSKSPALEQVEPFQTLEVDRLSFAYPGTERCVLDEASLKIRSGEIVALVGENGSGKTTLAKLLCHLYRPASGRILWDGRDTSEIAAESLREHIAVIFQDFVRYRLTAADNVIIGDVGRAEDRSWIEAAAQHAGAHSFLASLPKGYETILGKEFEEGTDLSVGQWQRVALARAFFRDAPFIVLDEPTASLDAKAEHELFESIRVLCRGRAVLLISHRFSSVRSADRIYVMQKGRIVEEGSHAELMAKARLYAEMFNLQAASYVDVPADARSPTSATE